MSNIGPIGVFDSGYGGLTVLKSIRELNPSHDYIYLGDNARSPYGPRSFEVVYNYTLQAVNKLFDLGCPLVILACNTASAKALRTIQQKDLPVIAPENRVLGVLRPTTEEIGLVTKSNNIGIMGTSGTVRSESYVIEIQKFFPEVKVFQQGCPMLVPMIENNDFNNVGGEYYIKKYIEELLSKGPEIDTIVLACTHYPIIEETIKKYLPQNITLFSQGDLVANKLKEYIFRHPEIETRLTKKGILSTVLHFAQKNDSHFSLNQKYESHFSSKKIYDSHESYSQKYDSCETYIFFDEKCDSYF